MPTSRPAGPGIRRISTIVGGSVGVAVAAGVARTNISADGGQSVAGDLVAGLFLGGFAALFAAGAAGWALANIARLRRWWAAHPTAASRLRLPLRVLGAVAVVAALGLFLHRAGWRLDDPATTWSSLDGAVLALLPAAFIVMFGAWSYRLGAPWLTRSRHASARTAAAIVLSAGLGVELFLLFNSDLLGTQVASVLVFPVGVWLSVLTWRAMDRAGNILVRAAADIVLSLMLGTDLVFLLVWFANLVDLPVQEVALLRGTLEHLKSVTDVPWWGWAALYAVLAALSLAMALRPQGLQAVLTWTKRVRLVPSVDAGRRTVTAAHFCLLAAALIGTVGPPAVQPTLQAQLRARYAVALQQEFDARGERCAYEAIRAAFRGDPIAPRSGQSLASVLVRIHDVAGPKRAGAGATEAEKDLARHVGQLQASVVRVASPSPVLSEDEAVADLRRLDGPVEDSRDLQDRLGRLEEREQSANDAKKQLEQAAELAAVAVASVIQVPIPGAGEVIQLIQEYLSGIVESSPIKEVFFEWAERHLFQKASPAEPPTATELALPDPQRLEIAAQLQVLTLRLRLLAEQGVTIEVRQTWAAEPPAEGAVDLVDQARAMQRQLASCSGCRGRAGSRPGESRRLPEERPVEPHPFIP